MNKEANKYLDIIKEYAPSAITYGLASSAGNALLQYIRNKYEKYDKKLSNKAKRRKLIEAALIGGGLGIGAGIINKSELMPTIINKLQDEPHKLNVNV